MLNRPALHDSRIGVAGCGSMGLPMARRLLGAGFQVSGFDVRPRAEFGDFAPRMIDQPERFAEQCDIVISVVRDYSQNRALCFDQQALFRAANPPRLLVVSSTLAPAQLHELIAELPPDSLAVDAPMSGAPVAAERGSLTFMLGGEGSAIEYLKPLFEAMGQRLVHVGAIGAGMTAKVLNNYVAGASVVAVRRVLAASKSLGLDYSRLLKEVMAHSSGNTWYGSQFDEISWSREGYSADNTIGIVAKDVRCAIATMEAAGLEQQPLDDAIVDALSRLETFR